jgi:SSS family solute:Na+ symporter
MTIHKVDLIVLLVYLAGVVAFGCWFARRSQSSKNFMSAGGRLPGWAVGLSIFGSYLSSNSFLGVPGKAFGSNWNAFVFSLSIPIAVIIGIKYFIPFYRKTGEISAYHHLEHRFGPWARTYGVVFFMLTHIARAGTILFGVSLGLYAMLGWDIRLIIVISGIAVTAYTLIGGIEAVIWTDVVQSIILTVGAGIVLILLLFKLDGGGTEAISYAWDNAKFDMGSLSPSLTQATFWVTLLYGIFINLNNFGIDQSFVQRYHTAKSEKEAKKSLLIGGLIYVPISAAFFLIGSLLFSFYQTHPEYLAQVQLQVMETRSTGLTGAELAQQASQLTAADIGDKVFPHFILNFLPIGFAGILIAALSAAAMSSIDSSLNSSSTVFLTDIYRRYIRPEATEKQSMRILHLSTLVLGATSITLALSLIRIKSVLDAWWQMQGIFASGMLGLFLLGLISKKAKSPAAAAALILGTVIIAWMSLSSKISELPNYLSNPLHANMTIVGGTMAILLIGIGLSRRSDANPTE